MTINYKCECCHKVQFEYMDEPRYECWGVPEFELCSIEHCPYGRK